MYKGQVTKGSLCPPNAETMMGGKRKMEALRGWGNRNKDKNIKKQDPVVQFDLSEAEKQCVAI